MGGFDASRPKCPKVRGETMQSETTLGEPVLVCRWRLAGRHVPLLNRHMRALSQRVVDGAPLTANLLGWAKQHIEWALAEDATVAADGVLMLVVDKAGRGVMSTGAYEPLTDASAFALVDRADAARREAAETGIAPEVLCAVRDGALVVGAAQKDARSGAATFICQLAETRGHAVLFEPDGLGDVRMGAVALLSDEHGVQPASDCTADPADADVLRFLAEAFEQLRDRTR